jgi:hypothetical protein
MSNTVYDALSYLIVLAALAFVARPWIDRALGRKVPASAACHSGSGSPCAGGCTGCPLAKAGHARQTR